MLVTAQSMRLRQIEPNWGTCQLEASYTAYHKALDTFGGVSHGDKGAKKERVRQTSTVEARQGLSIVDSDSI